jgi:hypothetical protein
MLGMITTFVYAVLTDRAVFIGWEQPLPLEMVFDSPYIDWSNRFLPSPAPSRHEIYDNKTRIDNRHPFDGHTAMAPHLMVLMTQMLQEEKVMNNPLVQVRCALSRIIEQGGTDFLSQSAHRPQHRQGHRSFQPPSRSPSPRSQRHDRAQHLRSIDALPFPPYSFHPRLHPPLLVLLRSPFHLLRRHSYPNW